MSSATGDEALVRRAQRGDRQALVDLYRRYLAEIYGYVCHQVGDMEDAEDVTSEVFLRMVSRLDGFRGQSSFRTWLYAVARNQLRDFWRRDRRRPSIADVDASRLPDGAGTETTPASPRATALGRQVLATLPPKYRRVLELRILEGRSVRDTAEALGTSVANVKVLQHRALKRAAEIAGSFTESEDDGPRYGT